MGYQMETGCRRSIIICQAQALHSLSLPRRTKYGRRCEQRFWTWTNAGLRACLLEVTISGSMSCPFHYLRETPVTIASPSCLLCVPCTRRRRVVQAQLEFAGRDHTKTSRVAIIASTNNILRRTINLREEKSSSSLEKSALISNWTERGAKRNLYLGPSYYVRRSNIKSIKYQQNVSKSPEIYEYRSQFRLFKSSGILNGQSNGL